MRVTARIARLRDRIALPRFRVPVRRDSRRVEPGEVFFAQAADAELRRRCIEEAQARGATCIVSPSVDDRVVVEHLVVPDVRGAYAQASALAHALDRRCPPVFGVTGTDGKTTTAEMIRYALGPGAARIGTLGWHDGREERPGSQTTPPPEEIHAFLAGLPVDCPGVAVEISSHAGQQRRLAGVPLVALAYTGLGRDHLDYHGDLESYLAAKLAICEGLGPHSYLFLNADDAYARKFVACAAEWGVETERIVGIGFHSGEARLREDGDGFILTWRGRDSVLPTALPGAYNAWNATAAVLAAVAAGIEAEDALARLHAVPGVPGRLELLAERPATYVDYAHTPLAVERCLRTLRNRYPDRPLVCVFGCGGDRDPGKRGPMGRAALVADRAVITNDNSRSEDPQAIAGQIIAGLPTGVTVDRTVDAASEARVLVELRRGPAIDLARRLAGPDGVVAVLGKGHERDQDFGDHVEAWDDRSYVRDGAGRVG